LTPILKGNRVLLSQKVFNRLLAVKKHKGFVYMNLTLRISALPEVQGIIFISFTELVSKPNGVFPTHFNKPFYYSFKNITS
jgi:hypothetical protein